MAKQKGIIKLEGTIGDITFYKSGDGYLAKENVTVTANRIATDPAFQRTRENMAEFGRAGKACKLLRNAVRPLLHFAKDSRVTGRLTAEMVKVIQADAINTRGQRNIIDGEAAFLEGFSFNSNAPLGSACYAPYTAQINRATGSLTVAFNEFIPALVVKVPSGATHFKLLTMGAELDFENETFITDQKETPMLQWNNNPVPAFILENTVTPASTHPLFLLMGIRFFQLVNGAFYPLKDESFNALSIIKVSGE